MNSVGALIKIFYTQNFILQPPSIADKLEPITSNLSPQQLEQQRQENSQQNNRSPFLESLFNVSESL